MKQTRLLYAGADLVMIGKLFAQCVESSGEKALYDEEDMKSYNIDEYLKENDCQLTDLIGSSLLKVKYQGMSTKESQMRYKDDVKPSEGKTSWINVKWTLNDWLNGSERDNDYLPGWVNSLKSAMSYTGSRTLKGFKQ